MEGESANPHVLIQFDISDRHSLDAPEPLRRHPSRASVKRDWNKACFVGGKHQDTDFCEFPAQAPQIGTSWAFGCPLRRDWALYGQVHSLEFRSARSKDRPVNLQACMKPGGRQNRMGKAASNWEAGTGSCASTGRAPRQIRGRTGGGAATLAGPFRLRVRSDRECPASPSRVRRRVPGGQGRAPGART